MRETAPLGQSLTTILQAVASFESREPFTDTISVFVLRNYTADLVVPYVRYFLYRQGIRPTVTLGSADTFAQDAIGLRDSAMRAPDLILLTLALEYLDPQSQSTGWDSDPARTLVVDTVQQLVTHTRSTIVAHTFLAPPYTEDRFGAVRIGHRLSKVDALNDDLVDLARRFPRRFILLDARRILERLGASRALDQRFGARYRAPYTTEWLASIAQETATIGGLLRGRMKKCLILDCDGTLWGGTAGEDGVDGVQLHPTEYPGCCYYELQRAVLNLIACGVIVCLCSKNDPADVFAVLEDHPHSLLKRQHLAAWRINWSPKHENVRSLAEELDLSLSAMVFVDDNPLECELVSAMVPDVTVVRAPNSPSLLPSLLYRDGWFDTLDVGEVDEQRTRLYSEDRVRKAAAMDCRDRSTFLRSLNLAASVRRADKAAVGRIAQLVARTNQFNLTTRRYSEADILAVLSRDDRAIFGLSAHDRFGDLGLVGVLIAEREESGGSIDTLLMSCRALGRDLEFAFVDRCLSTLEREWQVATWTARYVPGRRNGQVAEFWPRCGFTVAGARDGATTYRLDARERLPLTPSFISVAAQ